MPALILVEGESDRRAVEVVAALRGLDLERHGVAVVAMRGITNLGRHLAAVTNEVRVTGLYDVAEARVVHAALARRQRTEPFFACDRDLEDELIRALGTDRVVDVIHRAGDAAAWQTIQNQPFHRDRPRLDVLRRFMGTTSGRKLRYAGLLADALRPGEIPHPLNAVLDEAVRAARAG